MDRLVEALVLAEDEQNDEEHIDVVGAVGATVIELLQQRVNLRTHTRTHTYTHTHTHRRSCQTRAGRMR